LPSVLIAITFEPGEQRRIRLAFVHPHGRWID